MTKARSGGNGAAAPRLTATKTSDIQLPRHMLTLEHLRTKDGGPVTVIAELVEEARLLRVMRALPGLTIKQVRDEAKKVTEFDDLPDPLLDRALEMIICCIECGIVMLNDDGTEQRPAFSWSDPPATGAIPGRYLRAADQTAMFLAVLEVSGYGGAAGELSFLDEGREGRGTGVADHGVVSPPATPERTTDVQKAGEPITDDGAGG